MLGEQNGGYTDDVRSIAAELKEGIVVLNSEHLKKQFTYLGACASLEGVYAPRNAGHISPRNLIQAQQLLARRNGCDVINEVVNRITVLGSGDFQLETENSETTITAKKVLLTTGSFTNARELLPYQLELKLDLYGITVLLVSSCIRITVGGCRISKTWTSTPTYYLAKSFTGNCVKIKTECGALPWIRQ